jgi:phosphoglycerate kinase
MPYQFISQQDVKGKTLIVRCDLNSSIQDGTLVVSERIRQHAQTIKTLSDRGAKVVVLAHQGRKGDADFIGLEQHAQALSKIIGKPVRLMRRKKGYVDEIRSLQDREIVLMENVRFFDEEILEKTAQAHSQAEFVRSLASCADYFVQDALSVCHRPHASVVGFTALLPSFVGPALEKEILALQKISEVKENRLLVLGGAKPKDSLEMLAKMLSDKRMDKACVGGMFGELALRANGVDFGAKEKFFVDKGFGDFSAKINSSLSAQRAKILLPVDAALDANGKRKEIPIAKFPSIFIPKDIGKKTVKLFAAEIRKAKLIVFNGPMGVYESKQFALGTKQILSAISKSKAFSILGGGDTETALSMLNFKPTYFSHVSLAGKALLEYFAGKELPGLKALDC